MIKEEKYKIFLIKLNSALIGCKVKVVQMNAHFAILSLNSIFIHTCIRPLNALNRIAIEIYVLDIMMKMI
mgnify:CR=1 FL=1